MFSWIRRRATYANVAMTLALVFAMSGGAYAAKKYLITSTKQISPSVLKSLQGKAGPAGAQGPAGPAGREGPAGKEGVAGKEGKAGANGTNGESVTSASLNPGEGGCTEGGSKFTVGGKQTTACNGEKGIKGAAGEPWTPNNTLPSEATETGTWAFGPEAGEPGSKYVAVASFPIQLAKPLDENHVHLVELGKKTTECPGTAETPQAIPGNLCVYISLLESAEIGGIFQSTNFEFGAGRAGAFILLAAKGKEAQGGGTWAVTAE